jgi:hypothetical protein
MISENTRYDGIEKNLLLSSQRAQRKDRKIYKASLFELRPDKPPAMAKVFYHSALKRPGFQGAFFVVRSDTGTDSVALFLENS